MITIRDYFMGRDVQYAEQLTSELKLSAGETVRRVNLLLAEYGEPTPVNPATQSAVSSGWRPPAVNARTAGAAAKSRHMTCQAIDIYDPDGDIDNWCMDNLDKLAIAELWMEHPAATKGWCHLQIVPPRSGKRVFYP